MARPRAGLSGAALFVGIGGLYLAYAGVRDVPLVDGLRSLLRGERPAEKQAAFAAVNLARIAEAGSNALSIAGGAIQGLGGDTGIDRLVGNARMAYPGLKAAFPTLRMGGWRATGSVPGSRHPLGLAIDVMTTDGATAGRVIAHFRGTPGARTWIWNRQDASAPFWRVTPYSGPSPHTDHVHLDWF